MWLARCCLYHRSRILDYDSFGSWLYFCEILRCLNGHSLRESTDQGFHRFLFVALRAALFSGVGLSGPTVFLPAFHRAMQNYDGIGNFFCRYPTFCVVSSFPILRNSRCYRFGLQLNLLKKWGELCVQSSPAVFLFSPTVESVSRLYLFCRTLLVAIGKCFVF